MGRKSLGKDYLNARLKRNRWIRELIESGQLNARQGNFLRAFALTRSKTRAAIQAGYKGPPHQAGYQAYKAIQRKAPDVIALMGITLENVIENHILPQMSATDTKLAQHKGRFTDAVEVPNPQVRLAATRTLLELMNAFPTSGPQAAEEDRGVKVIVVDAPRPSWPKAESGGGLLNGTQASYRSDKND